MNQLEELPNFILRQIHDENFSYVFEFWHKKLEEEGYLNEEFSETRKRQMLHFCYLGEKKFFKDIELFLEMWNSYSQREFSKPNAIQIMTIHKSKGLGFDIVFLPDLEGSKLTSLGNHFSSNPLKVKRDEDGNISWVYRFPPSEICNFQDSLREFHNEEVEKSVFEQLCKLYVAVTRSKLGLYLFLDEPTNSHLKVRPGLGNFTHLLLSSFVESGKNTGKIIELGDPEFYKEYKEEFSENFQESKVIIEKKIKIRKEKRPISPSKREEFREIKINNNLEAVNLGIEIHRILAKRTWISEMPNFFQIDSEILHLESSFQEKVRKKLKKHFQNEDFIKVFQRESFSKNYTLWLEKEFDIELENGKWVNGVFDRVIIEEFEGAELGLKATIYDFKVTESRENTQKRYKNQIEIYRLCLANLLAIPLELVKAEIVVLN